MLLTSVDAAEASLRGQAYHWAWFFTNMLHATFKAAVCERGTAAMLLWLKG